MKRLKLPRCHAEISKDPIRFKPDSDLANPTLALTTKTASLRILNQLPAMDFPKLTLEQYVQIAGVPQNALQTLKQSHTNKVVTYSASDSVEPPPQADAIVINGVGKYGGVFVADCLAMLLFATDSKLCAAVHIGWRGALSRIGSAALASLRSLGANPRNIIGVLAAGICVKCYRVGEEVYQAFLAANHVVDAIFTSFKDGWHLDLKQAAARDLVEYGVPASNIYDSQLCSFCEADLLWSYRRDGKKALRNLAFCGWEK